MMVIKVKWRDYYDKRINPTIVSSRLIRDTLRNISDSEGLLSADIFAEVGFTCFCTNKKTVYNDIEGSFVFYGQNKCFGSIEEAKKFAEKELSVTD